MTKPLTIWCNPAISASAHELLVAGTKPHRLLFTPVATYNLHAGPPDPALLGAEIAFGQPDPETVLEAEKLRWIHLSSAGYARYDTAEIRAALAARGAILTNSSAVYAEPCAEHLLAFMLAHARQLLPTYRIQLEERTWPTEPLRVASRLMLGQSVLLLGYGAIARRLVALLQPFAMKIVALRRNPSGDEGVPTITTEALDRALADADHVVNTLPEGDATAHFVNAKRFAAMKGGAIFYNVGRGGTVDQEALLEALRWDELGAAYLDVTEPEPLPPNHPLWLAPRCYITPHTAGGHADEHERFVRHFLANLARFTAGEPLHDQVM
ncbi:MAG: D-2-hydroxyacid dehydrogenase [Chthoniobacterales bacterium]